MPIDAIDKNNPSITGDPEPVRPLSPKGMQGAQARNVNRMRQGPQVTNPARQSAAHPAPQDGGTDVGSDAEAAQTAVKAAGHVIPQLGAAQAVGDWAQEMRTEADKAYGFDPSSFNPMHGIDWFKAAAETPEIAYHMGRHIYDAYFGAFLDPNAIRASVQNVYHQDGAVAHAFDLAAGDPFGQRRKQNQEALQQVASLALPIGANPMNLIPFAGGRGLAQIASFMAPSAISAVFGQGDAASELTWGGAAALLFGGKLPPAVEKQLATSAPAALKLFDKIGATQRAQDASKVASQDPNKFLDQLVKSADPGRVHEIAPAWAPNIDVYSAEETLAKRDEYWRQSEVKRLQDEYQTLDPDQLIPKMVAAGASETRLRYAWTHLLRQPYALEHITPAEAPVRDPRIHFETLSPELRDKAVAGFPWVVHAAQRASRGPIGHGMSPEISRFRSLVGIERSTPVVIRKFQQHLLDMLGPHDESVTNRIYQAIEGDQAVYEKLRPVEKYVTDSLVLLARGIRRGEVESGRGEHFVSDWWKRVSLVRDKDGTYHVGPSGGAAGVLRGQGQPHRALGTRQVLPLNPDEPARLQVVQKHATIEEAKSARLRLQNRTVEQILDGTPTYEMEVPEAAAKEIDHIRTSLTSDPEWAQAEAKRLAEELHPELSTNPFDSFPRIIGQIQAIHSWHAIQDLLATTDKEGNSLAIEKPTSDDGVKFQQSHGYQVVNVAGFRGVMVRKSYADLLEKAAKLHREYTDLGDVWEAGRKAWSVGAGLPTKEREAATLKAIGSKGLALLKNIGNIEGQAVASIMYSPRIHGMNLAARLGMLSWMDPKGALQLLIHGFITHSDVSEIASVDDAIRAWDAGVIPPSSESAWSEKFIATGANLTGDVELGHTPLLRDTAHVAQDLKQSPSALQFLGKAKDLLWGKQSELWEWNSTFGVWAYNVELKHALASGRFAGEGEHERASLYAARRANSWMGHVAPEDQNPHMHQLFKSVFFAPNWWRSWGELLTGIYKNSGVGWNRDTMHYVVANELKTMMAAVAMQQLTADALNYMLSGHSLFQNDPGNWGKVEITAPWAVAAANAAGVKIDPKTGRDAEGRKLTMENPLARQMADTEQALGLLSPAPHPSEATLEQGLRSFAAARLSPVFNSAAALANIDLYRSIANGQTSYMDPNHDHMRVPGTNTYDDLAAIAQLTPFSYLSGQVQQTMLAGHDPTAPTPGPFGTTLPAAIAAVANNAGGDAVKMMLIGLTGINAPHMRSSKTFGTPLSDDQYRNVHELQTQYDQTMNAMSTSALSGQMTPYQWLSAYRQVSTVHAAQMQSIYRHAPAFNEGPLGLVNSWEATYDAATKNGVTDLDLLRQKQREWRANHSGAEYAMVRSELRSHDQKYPMLALYHKTLDAYDNWQNDYCRVNGIDLETLRHDLNGYAQVYGDRVASSQWLAAHPDISPYENAKKAEFEAGNSTYGEAGLMYALFFNPSGAQRYLNASGQTAAQVEQTVQKQEVAAS